MEFKLADEVKRNRGRPTTGASQDLSDVILNHAADILLKKGFHDTTIEDIALRSGTTRRTVTRRFNTKLDILLGVIEMRILQFTAAIEMADQPPLLDPMEEIRTTCRRLYEMAFRKDAVNINRLVITTVDKFEEVSSIFRMYNERFEMYMELKVDRAKRKGYFANRNSRSVAILLISLFSTFPTMRSIVNDTPAEHARDKSFQAMWEFVPTL